jgi:universal stress protein A
MASTRQAELHVVHVVDHLHGFDHFQILAMTPDEIAKRLEADAVERLTSLRAGLTQKGPTNFELIVRHGKASHQIVEMAKEIEADLIVVGNHGKTGLAKALLGSVAEAVVRSASCSVLVAK